MSAKHGQCDACIADESGGDPGLDDLCVRFIINLPREELESVERICFQVEEAQWFYEDFIRPLDPALPSLSLKAFALRIFQHCPLMSKWSHFHHVTAFSEFLAYKTRVPVRGAIMLNYDMDEVVLVKGWKKGANWSFPRGKINKDEKDLDCAIREVYEETGFDVREANLIQDGEAVKYIEITMREQHMRLYVFRGVPRDTHFAPRTRKEISKIEWYKLSELPTLNKKKQLDDGLAVANANKFYMVAPFLHPLKKWIAQQKRSNARIEAGLNPVSHAEGYMSMDENGLANNIAAPELAVPSDLPEVTSGQDASSHIKQLLKIGGPVPVQVPIQGSAPAQATGGEQSKSNALLELLRNGSQEAVSQIPQARNDPVASSTVTPSGMPQGTQAPHLAPNFFPGFPQQQQHLTSSSFMQQSSMRFQNGLTKSDFHSTVGANQRSPFLAAGRPELSASPMHLPLAPVPNYHPHSAAPVSAPPRSVLAPFQQTGDPHFTQSVHPVQVQSAAAPPASKLPPPKLNSHSLALLNFFKDNATSSPKASPTATLAAPTQGPSQTRKTSQHQDSLLNLFKGSRTMPESPPVELSGHPISSAPPSEMHILQRPPQQAEPPVRTGNDGQSSPTGPAQTLATVPGPTNLPQVETIPKRTPKKTLNGPGRRNNPNRREREHTKNQQPHSPITILSRPQAAKGDGATMGVNAPPKQSPPPAQSFISQPQAPEPVKPFQPQIIRRSEKTGHENLLTGSSQVTNAGRKPSLSGLQTNAAELAPQSNFDRRPSQTNAQKEALLSLFGKAQASPVLGSATTAHANQPPTAASGLVSPVSSFQVPSSGESLSRRGTPSEVGSHRVASPNNKAFLLGYLQGVAKGNK